MELAILQMGCASGNMATREGKLIEWQLNETNFQMFKSMKRAVSLTDVIRS